MPSGRALLPDSLESADELVGSLSPAARIASLCQASTRNAFGGPVDGAHALGKGRGEGVEEGSSRRATRAAAARTTAELEAELEAEFFATVSRDAEEVVAEEMAAAGIRPGIRLMDPLLALSGDGGMSSSTRGGGIGGLVTGEPDLRGAEPSALAPPSSSVSSEASEAHEDSSSALLVALLGAWPDLVARKTVLQLQVCIGIVNWT